MIKLEPFLLPTEFCDSDNPEVISMAKKIAQNEQDPMEQAKLIKEWLQENIIYRFDFLNVKASETLEKRIGQCTNKANLQIAFLRTLKIPAAYGLLAITKEVFYGSTPPEFYEKIAQPTTHVYCRAYDEKFEIWRHFDATPHKALRELERKHNISLRFYAPNGESRYKRKYMASEIFIHSNIDHMLKVPHRWLNEAYIKKANDYLEKLEKGASK